MGDLNHGVTTVNYPLPMDIISTWPRTDTVELRKWKSEWSLSNSPILSQCPFMIMWTYGFDVINGVMDKAVLDEAAGNLLKRIHLGMKSRIAFCMIQLSDFLVATSGSVECNPCDQSKDYSFGWANFSAGSTSWEDWKKPLYGLKDCHTMLLRHVSMQQASRISDKTAFFLMGIWLSTMTPMKCFLNPAKKETGKFG